MNRFMNVFLKTSAILAGFLLLFLTFIIAYTILARFLRISGPVWAVQFTEYALLWMTLLGAAWVLQRQKHVSVDLITGRLSPRVRAYFDLAHGVMGIAVCGVLCWYGTIVTWGQWQRGVTDIQVVDTPKYLILIIIPMGFLFLIVQFLRQFLIDLQQIKNAGNPFSQGHDSSGQPVRETQEKTSAGGDI
jgi:C4-dicarboxylate transporter DctQ subunit